tara:strand:+ start:728 stop:1414 length:687 start_codon:yes stop_codon:yes gene_type:complete
MIRTGLFFTLIALAIACAFSWYGWTHTAPGDQIPVHFGLNGEADRFGSRAEGFLVMPAFLVGLAFLMSIVPTIDPRGKNVRRSRPVYLAGWLIGAAAIAGAQGFITWTAVGGQPDADLLSRSVTGFVAVIMLVLGAVLGKARPNFFVGIRTPWTLSSDLAWDKTHRWGGRLFLVLGIAGLALALLGPVPISAVLTIAALLGVAIGLVVYSFIVWKKDPARETLSPDDA